jgi:hypothetical protein
MPLTHTKRAGTRRTDAEEEHGTMNQWRGAGDDSQADGGVFALDGDDDLDMPGSYKKRKRKANLSSVPHSYMDEDMDQKDSDRPGRYALPAAAAILSAASASNHTSLNHPLVLGNGNGLKHNLSDGALDASAALSQLSTVAASNRNAGTSVAGGTGFGSAFSSNTTFSSNSANTSPGASGGPVSKTVAATNAWMVAFAQGVSPFTSSAPFTPLEPLELQRILSLDMEQLHGLAPELLARALMQCAMLAHGSRYTGNLETSAQHGWKAWQLVKVCLGRKRVHTIATLAQTLVSSLELLAYYFLGTSDFFKVRTVVQHAYHVFVNHRHFLADSTAHRVLGLMIGASCSIEDTEFWLAKAKALNLQATTPYETSGWVVLALMLSSGVIGLGDRDILPFRTKQLQDRDFSHKMSILHVIDESDKAVAFFEATPTCLNDIHSQKVCKIHKAVLDGCRALILWQCGFDKEASTSVARVVAVGKPSEVSRLPHLMALAWCTQIARHLNLRQLYSKGLEYLEEGTFSYAYIRMLSDELKKSVSLTDSIIPEESGSSMLTPDDGNSGSSGASTLAGANLSGAMSGAPNALFKTALPAASVFARSGSGGFTSKLGTSPSILSSPGPSRLSMVGSGGSQSAGEKANVFGGNGATSSSPRTDEEAGMNGITPMRPNPMKVTTVSSIFNRGASGAAQSVSPQMQSVSPQLSMSPHHLQGVSPHLLQGVSPLAQGLSPFTTLGGTPLIQPHLMPHLNQFSPQIPSFLGIGSTFSPGTLGQSTSPNWAGASALNNEYLMDSSEPNQWN